MLGRNMLGKHMLGMRLAERFTRVLARLSALTVIVSLTVGGFPTPAPAAVNFIFTMTGSTSWTVPPDWNSSNNTVEVSGGGGGGATGSESGGAGGTGGSYAKKSNVSLTPGGTATIFVGTGGGAGVAGGDSYFN